MNEAKKARAVKSKGSIKAGQIYYLVPQLETLWCRKLDTISFKMKVSVRERLDSHVEVSIYDNNEIQELFEWVD